MSLLVQSESLAELVSTINHIFEDALAFVRQSRQHTLARSGGTNWSTLEKCLRQAPRDIERELIDGIDHWGPSFATGDGMNEPNPPQSWKFQLIGFRTGAQSPP